MQIRLKHSSNKSLPCCSAALPGFTRLKPIKFFFASNKGPATKRTHTRAFYSCQALERKNIYMYMYIYLFISSPLWSPRAAHHKHSNNISGLSLSLKRGLEKPPHRYSGKPLAERKCRFICFPAEIKVVKSLREAGVCKQKKKKQLQHGWINLAACRCIHQRFLWEQRDSNTHTVKSQTALARCAQGDFLLWQLCVLRGPSRQLQSCSSNQMEGAYFQSNSHSCNQTSHCDKVVLPRRECYLGGNRAEQLRKQSVRPGRVDRGLVHTHG